MSEDTERVTKLLNDIEVLVSDLFLGHRNFSPTEHCGRIQHALGEARHALATAEASAAAVAEIVRSEMETGVWAQVKPNGEPSVPPERDTFAEGYRFAQGLVGDLLDSLPTPSEALAARDRATAERAREEIMIVEFRCRYPRAGEATLRAMANERLSALGFPASGRTTTEGG